MGSFIGAITPALFAARRSGRGAKMRQKGEQSLSAMFSVSGLALKCRVRDWPNVVQVERRVLSGRDGVGVCVGCLGSAGLEECFGRVDQLLDEADQVWTRHGDGTMYDLGQDCSPSMERRLSTCVSAKMNDIVRVMSSSCARRSKMQRFCNIFSMATAVEVWKQISLFFSILTQLHVLNCMTMSLTNFSEYINHQKRFELANNCTKSIVLNSYRETETASFNVGPKWTNIIAAFVITRHNVVQLKNSESQKT